MSHIQTFTNPVAAAMWLATDELISTDREDREIAAERDEIDRLLESVDRELAAESRHEGARLWLDAAAPVRARRSRRRGERAVLRALPVRLVEDRDEWGAAA